MIDISKFPTKETKTEKVISFFGTVDELNNAALLTLQLENDSFVQYYCDASILKKFVTSNPFSVLGFTMTDSLK